ncbi:hypothetical protein ACOMHN_048030 [Nucella lapillus]
MKCCIGVDFTTSPPNRPARLKGVSGSPDVLLRRVESISPHILHHDGAHCCSWPHSTHIRQRKINKPFDKCSTQPQAGRAHHDNKLLGVSGRPEFVDCGNK